MRAAPNMLLIGAARRQAGKTLFACAAIEALRGLGRSVVGAKVTTVRPGDGRFHPDAPGREDILSGRRKYLLFEERATDAGNDTARMLRAGARRAFWLIASPAFLAEAARALLARVRPADVVVCESNSLRLAMAPGHFVIVDRREGAGSAKPSAACSARFPHEAVMLTRDARRTRRLAARAAGVLARERCPP